MIKSKYKRMFFLLCWPFGLALFWGTAYYPRQVENYYAAFSKEIARLLSLASDTVSFSLAEFLVLLLVLGLSAGFIRSIYRQFAGQKDRNKKGLGVYLINLAILLGIIYFCFVAVWGLNYNRQEFAEIAGLKVEAADQSELEELCYKLINRANYLRLDLAEDERGVMTIQGGFREVREDALLGFEQASELYPELGGRYGKAKPVCFSKKMSYAGISGIYFPFTGEANVNIDIPFCLLPATTCHEMAHQRGFAREDEANYIAWVTCSANPNPEFQYSGALLALVHSLNALFSTNPEKASELVQSYNEGVLRDLSDVSAYWKKHQGKVEEITSDINDAYLKSNRQEEGIQSYGQMVDLLLAEQKADADRIFLSNK